MARRSESNHDNLLKLRLLSPDEANSEFKDNLSMW